MSLASVRLSAGAEAEIRRLAAAAYPHEGCGVLIGAYTGDSVAVEEATSGRNLWSERLRDRYDLDPADIRAADATWSSGCFSLPITRPSRVCIAGPIVGQ